MEKGTQRGRTGQMTGRGESASAGREGTRTDAGRRLTYKEQREMEGLPAQIEALEAEQAELYRQMADPETYRQGGGEVTAATARLAEIEGELEEAYARWEELEGKQGT